MGNKRQRIPHVRIGNIVQPEKQNSTMLYKGIIWESISATNNEQPLPNYNILLIVFTMKVKLMTLKKTKYRLKNVNIIVFPLLSVHQSNYLIKYSFFYSFVDFFLFCSSAVHINWFAISNRTCSRTHILHFSLPFDEAINGTLYIENMRIFSGGYLLKIYLVIQWYVQWIYTTKKI